MYRTTKLKIIRFASSASAGETWRCVFTSMSREGRRSWDLRVDGCTVCVHHGMFYCNRDHNHNHNHNHLTTRVIPDHSHLSLSRHLLPHRAHCWTLTTDHGSLSHSLRLQPHFTNVGPQFHPPLNQFVRKIIPFAVQRWAPFPGPQTKQHGTGRTMVSKMCKIFAP